MNLMEAMSTIKLDRAAIILLVLADTLGCGLLVIFVCWPALITGIEAVKLGMVALALTLPFAAAGTFAYLVGLARQDYAVLPERLSTAIFYGVSMHVVVVLASLAAGELAMGAPSPVWLPAPTSVANAFWYGSAFYVLYMAYAGRSGSYGIGRRLIVPIVVVIILFGTFASWRYARWHGWW